MSFQGKQTYFRYAKNIEYDENVSPEQIIADIKKYNETITQNNQNILFAFSESCHNIDLRINVSYINPNEITGYHYHDFYELIYVFKGHILQYIDGKNFIINPGNLLFLHPEISHSFYSYSDSIAVNILVKKEYLERFLFNFRSRIKNCYINHIVDEHSYALFVPTKNNEILLSSILSLCDTSSLNPIAKKLIGINTNDKIDTIDALLSEQMLQYLLLSLVKGVKNGTINIKTLSHSRNSTNLNEIIPYIRENYQNVTIAELSQKFGYSPTQMRRIIKSSTGNCLTAIIMEMRISRVKYLLKNSNYPVSRISSMVGIESYEYLSRMFKNRTGYTPSDYRRLSKVKTIL